jgi:hypothetical protein
MSQRTVLPHGDTARIPSAGIDVREICGAELKSHQLLKSAGSIEDGGRVGRKCADVVT